jgi:hypothetical protein
MFLPFKELGTYKFTSKTLAIAWESKTVQLILGFTPSCVALQYFKIVTAITYCLGFLNWMTKARTF